jgi:hypothetical protein
MAHPGNITDADIARGVARARREAIRGSRLLLEALIREHGPKRQIARRRVILARRASIPRRRVVLVERAGPTLSVEAGPHWPCGYFRRHGRLSRGAVYGRRKLIGRAAAADPSGVSIPRSPGPEEAPRSPPARCFALQG